MAGVAAATLLVEQGVPVTLLERDARLGGRAGGWTDLLRDGTLFEMERGTLRFGRSDRNVRALIQRVDPALSTLVPLERYPLLSPDGALPSLARRPKGAPRTVMDLLRRVPSVRVRELMRADLRLASMLFAYDPEETFTRLDHTSAKAFLDDMRLPGPVRDLLGGLIGHAAFDALDRYSAAELVGLLHAQVANDTGGVQLDVMQEPTSRALWQPIADYLHARGAEVATRSEVLEIDRGPPMVVRFRTRGVVKSREAGALVLAADVVGLQRIVEASPGLAGLGPAVRSLEVSLPTAVWRLWLDRPLSGDRAPMAVTIGRGMLDAISIPDRISRAGASWARARGGGIVELHAYAVPATAGDAAIRANLLAQLHATYPETRGAKILDERFSRKRDFPAFRPGSRGLRPTVTSPLPGVFLAGDFTRLPFPSAPMERAAASGFLAANAILGGWGKRTRPIAHGPIRGALA
jgi:isorenieratene synthase